MIKLKDLTNSLTNKMCTVHKHRGKYCGAPDLISWNSEIKEFSFNTNGLYAPNNVSAY